MQPTSNGHPAGDPNGDHVRQQSSPQKPQPRPVVPRDADSQQPLHYRVRQIPSQPTAADENLLAAPTKIARPFYDIGDDGAVRVRAHAVAQTPATKPARSHAPLFLVGLTCALIATLTSVVGSYMLFAESDPPPIVLHSPLAPPPTATLAPTPTPAPVVVFVSGAVRNVGVYHLPVDARVNDAIMQAGGLLPNAAQAAVNQAQKLFDGAQIHIPFETDAAAALPQVAPAPPIGLSASGLLGSDAPRQEDTGSRVDLNAASQAAIESLPGIGASKAREIIAGRPYERVDDLANVSGIGEKTVDALREFVTVE